MEQAVRRGGCAQRGVDQRQQRGDEAGNASADASTMSRPGRRDRPLHARLGRRAQRRRRRRGARRHRAPRAGSLRAADGRRPLQHLRPVAAEAKAACGAEQPAEKRSSSGAGAPAVTIDRPQPARALLASFHSGRWVFSQMPPPGTRLRELDQQRHEQLLGQA